MAEFVAAGRKWNVHRIAKLYIKDESGTHQDAFQIDTDTNEIRLAEFVDSDSFYAGMRARDAMTEEPKRGGIPLFDDVLKDDAEDQAS